MRAEPENQEAAARAGFPRGLHQPDGSYRFAVDSLLLASFLHVPDQGRLLDLGAGCGVVALAVLCGSPGALAWAVEREPELAKAARVNAAMLGYADRLCVIQADVADETVYSPGGQASEGLMPGSFDVILANPPFRSPEKGRLPPGEVRKRALFEEKGTLEAFCACAARALAPEGRFGLLYDANRLDYLLETLRRTRLSPLRVLPVRSLAHKAPFRLLVEAARDSEAASQLAPVTQTPLALHDERGGMYSEAARAFCPYLRSF